MRTKLILVVTAVGLLVAAVPVGAHHAFAAEFDSTKPVKLRGTVTKMEWINPHSWIHMDVKSPDGKVISWMIEGGSQLAAEARRYEEFPAAGHGNPCRWLSGQGRVE